ncbi:mannose-1-phosphate guanylyltransferase/mannose-6-phosphate isomerase [Sphingomonas bacterium]|uniref:mannose-1-phosphate guanylyltransferase/mannose-6-phosphate isomerase n=1 Tax=Sphingomonas bacterium TaxID=1895847 RepID=UPI0015755060|nr:mannose-1-phosphate guanylyltransferase/mannose-6-phosphate isomerase [Sphingomonas bacterium]
MTTQVITPVILSGGSGTRLWPLSRTAKPKQLLSLTGAETMLQQTVRRTLGSAAFASPIIVANAAHAGEIERQLGAVGVAESLLILEPAARNTAAAIALAALVSPADALLLVMPSDHVIADVPAFHRAIAAVAPLCGDGWLATFGITPDGPETGYGYIKRGPEIGLGVQQVERFVEKPDLETAKAYLADGSYSWNGGIFLFTAGAYLAALAQHGPAILAAAQGAMEGARREGARVYPARDAFEGAPNEPIDTAVMEKAEKIAVVPIDMGWSDVGSWDALHAIASRDADENAHHGEIVAIDTSGCLLRTDGPLIAAVGIKDLIVIATTDAVLILPRGSSQDVKRAVEALKRDGHVSLDRFPEARALEGG